MKDMSIHEVIDLLDRKNKYLSDFRKINTEELVRIQKGNLNNLETFYFDREVLLNAIDRLDQSMQGCKLDQLEDVCDTSRKKVLDLLTEKKKLINGIISQDLDIHSRLESQATTSKKEQAA